MFLLFELYSVVTMLFIIDPKMKYVADVLHRGFYI